MPGPPVDHRSWIAGGMIGKGLPDKGQLPFDEGRPVVDACRPSASGNARGKDHLAQGEEPVRHRGTGDGFRRTAESFYERSHHLVRAAHRRGWTGATYSASTAAAGVGTGEIATPHDLVTVATPTRSGPSWTGSYRSCAVGGEAARSRCDAMVAMTLVRNGSAIRSGHARLAYPARIGVLDASHGGKVSRSCLSAGGSIRS